MPRKFPIYVLVDNSLSTALPAAQKIDDLMVAFLKTVFNDPYALETAFVSILKFGGEPKVIVPILPILEYEDLTIPPYYRYEGPRNVGAGIELLVKRIRLEVNMQTGRDRSSGQVFMYPKLDRKRDWTPLVILLVGGNPDDDINRGVIALREIGRVDLKICCCSRSCDSGIYRELSNDVYDVSELNPIECRSFFDGFWKKTGITISVDDFWE